MAAIAGAHFAEPFLVSNVMGILLSYTLRPLASLLKLAGLVHIIPYVGTIVASTAIGAAMFLQTGSLSEGIVAWGMVVAIASAISVGLASWMQGRVARMHPVAVFIEVAVFWVALERLGTSARRAPSGRAEKHCRSRRGVAARQRAAAKLTAARPASLHPAEQEVSVPLRGNVSPTFL
jgi:hypothetical protein